MTYHVIFGAGLIGCYLGGAMQANGLNVHLICRPTVQKKLAGGLRLTDYQAHSLTLDVLQFISSQAISTLTPGQPPCDFLWLTVKCTGVARASQDIQPLVNQHTVILCCQNGLGAEQSVKQAYPHNLVLRVMVPFNVVELSAGHLHRGSEGALCIEARANCPITPALINAISCEMLPVRLTSDIQSLLWAKLQLNLGNSVNALADTPVKSMLEQRAYRLVIATLMDELLAVTYALKITLPRVTAIRAEWLPGVLRLPDFLFRLVANKMLAIDPQVRTSMCWDVSRGKPTEINYLNGAVVRHGQRCGILCPANRRIISLIEAGSGKHPEPYRAEQLLAQISR